MKHTAHKRIAHFKKRYKHIAAAFAGAILMSSALLPGIPIASVDAAVNPNGANTRDTSAQKMKNENREENALGQKINSSKNPRNGSRTKVSGSEARNLIKQNFSRNKILKSRYQSTNVNAADKSMKRSANHNPIPQAVSSSPTKADPSATVQAKTENKYSKSTTSMDKDHKNEAKAKHNPSNAAPVSDKQGDKQNSTTHNSQKPPEKGDAAKTDHGEKSSGDIPSKYEKVLNISATAYAPGPLDNDQWGDKTYMGTTIRPGVIAVDPKVIPLGSRLYVQYPDGHGEYAVAEDTGGAIKGNRIDIAMMNRAKATEFGIQDVKVYVVSSPEKE